MKLVDIQALEQLKSISNPIQVGKLIFFIETELQMDSNHYCLLYTSDAADDIALV